MNLLPEKQRYLCAAHVPIPSPHPHSVLTTLRQKLLVAWCHLEPAIAPEKDWPGGEGCSARAHKEGMIWCLAPLLLYRGIKQHKRERGETFRLYSHSINAEFEEHMQWACESCGTDLILAARGHPAGVFPRKASPKNTDMMSRRILEARTCHA